MAFTEETRRKIKETVEAKKKLAEQARVEVAMRAAEAERELDRGDVVPRRGVELEPGIPSTEVTVADKIQDPITIISRHGLSADGSFKPFHTDLPEPEPQETASDRFAVWLSSPGGRFCSDPRVPESRMRFCVDLEDRLRRAFLAGAGE